MRIFRYALIAGLFVTLGVAVYQTVLWLRGNQNESQVLSLEGEDQEIAFIEPATSGEEWGRLVTSVQLLEKDWPRTNPNLPAVNVSLDRAFPPLTTDVPEAVFAYGNSKAKLRLRWYKISGEHDAVSWVAKLQARKRQPLAIVGGGTSDRAVKLAYTLKKAYGDDPDQPAPVFLITTATSEKTTSGKSLIHVYRNRTFRFSFTNRKMVESLLAFAERRHYPAEDKEWAHTLWVNKPSDPATVPGAADATLHAVTWEDERYSQDMNSLFDSEFKKRYPTGEFNQATIPYSVGGFFQPAPQEQVVVNTFLALRTPVAPHSFLAVPTQTVRMRRFLINLRQRSPDNARKLVILNGDSISFHVVYRDREVLWNILDLPYSLAFFSHRNPIEHAAGFTWTKVDRPGADKSVPQPTPSGTHDVLLYRDLFESILYAAYDQGSLVGDPLRVRARLQATCWHQPPPDKSKLDPARVCNSLVHSLEPRPPRFFDADGNRQSHTGEHIVWVKPSFTDDNVDLVSKISVWAVRPNGNGVEGGAWHLVEAQAVTYNQVRPEDAQ